MHKKKQKLAEIAAEAKYVEKKQELQHCAEAEARLKALERMNQENNYPEGNCHMLHNPLNVFINPAEQMFSSKIEHSRKTKEEIETTEESTKNISGYGKNKRRILVDQFQVPYYSNFVPHD